MPAKVEFFALRDSISQAIFIERIQHIIVITDTIMKKKLFLVHLSTW